MPAFVINANEAFDSYSELIAAINDWLDRDDLNEVAPQFISMAEDEMRIQLEPFFLEATTGLMADDQGFATLPADLKTLNRVLLGERVLNNWSARGVDCENNGTTPRGYTLERGGIRLWPNNACTVTVLYQPLIARLTNANPTNNLLDLFPSLYFYGAMTFAHAYISDFDKARSFRSLFDNMLNEVKGYYMRQRYSGPLKPHTPNVP